VRKAVPFEVTQTASEIFGARSFNDRNKKTPSKMTALLVGCALALLLKMTQLINVLGLHPYQLHFNTFAQIKNCLFVD